jgi:predicted nucleic acid-binding protein
MIVVSDTSPLNYLILIDEIDVLPGLFANVLVPPTVLSELADQRAPQKVRDWASSPPIWLAVRAPLIEAPSKLHPGEAAAIALAIEVRADFLLIDEREGTRIATERGLVPLGLVAVLLLARERGLIDLRRAVQRLRATSFRAVPQVWGKLDQACA